MFHGRATNAHPITNTIRAHSSMMACTIMTRAYSLVCVCVITYSYRCCVLVLMAISTACRHQYTINGLRACAHGQMASYCMHKIYTVYYTPEDTNGNAWLI